MRKGALMRRTFLMRRASLLQCGDTAA